METSGVRGPLGAWACSALLLVLLPAQAGEEADRALDQASEALVQGRDFDAVVVLEKALEGEPENTALLYFLGRAYNRLQMHASAFTMLRRAEGLGHDSPSFRLELGETLLALGRPDEALVELVRGPDSARCRMARATALVDLGRAEEALAELDAALALDPSAEPAVRVMRASALARLGREGEAETEIALAREKGAAEELLSLYAKTRLPEDAPSKRWGFALTLGFGYNDNVTLRPDDTLAAFDRKDDEFFRESATIWARPLGNERRGVLVRLDGLGLQNLEEEDFSVAQGGPSVDAYTTHGRFRFEAGGSYLHSGLGGDEFSRAWTGRGAIRFTEASWTRTSFGVSWSEREFFFDSLEAEDRDGDVATLSLSQELVPTVFGRRVRLMPSLHVGREETEGDSAENRFWGLGLAVRAPLTERLGLFGHAAYRERDYLEEHVRTGFLEERRDLERSFGAGVTYAFTDMVSATFEWDRADVDSNLSESFSYERDTYTLSITLRR